LAVCEWTLTVCPHLWRAYPRYFSGSTLLAYSIMSNYTQSAKMSSAIVV